jgi:hypothetical protein
MYKFDRITKILLTLLVIGVWCLLLQPFIKFSPVEAQSKPAPNHIVGEISPIIKTRSVINNDNKGRERVILGAPVPDPEPAGYPKRVSPAHGMIILDPEGFERFGVGLMDNGQMGMGFDAPRGKGDDRNRE